MPACDARHSIDQPGESRSLGIERGDDGRSPVLFADVVGSTALERLSPDEVKALIGECVSRMSAAVEEFDRTIQGLPRPTHGATEYLQLVAEHRVLELELPDGPAPYRGVRSGEREGDRRGQPR